MKKKSPTNSRRDLLKVLATLPATFPLQGFAQMLVNGLVSQAEAASTSVKNYVYFSTNGAPPRWVFDLLLTPYSEAGFVANKQIGTVGVVEGGRYTSVAYKTIKKAGINVPPLWGAQVPVPGGGFAPIESLLNNLLVIRGIDTQAPAHPAARIRAYRPIAAEYTVTGLVADLAQGLPLKGINVGAGGYEFTGRNSSTPAVFPGDKGAALGGMVLNPFSSQATSAFTLNKAALEAEIDHAQQALDSYALGQHPGSQLIREAQTDVNDFMRKAVATLGPKWEAVYKKYAALVERAVQVRLPGVHDKPLGAATRSATDPLYSYKASSFVTTPVNLNEVFTKETSVRAMADSFALAEFALTEKLSNSICAHVGGLTGLKVNGENFDWNPDEHSCGALMSLTGNTVWYGAFGACLLELVTRLKSVGIFKDTVIQVGAEFNRSPQDDGGGSSHGYQAQSYAIYSGMVDGPLVIGNVLNRYPGNKLQGSWGAAAPSISGRVLDNADMANALAVMLGLPEIVRRGPAQTIIKMVNGKVVSNIGKGKQV